MPANYRLDEREPGYGADEHGKARAGPELTEAVGVRSVALPRRVWDDPDWITALVVDP